MSVAANLLAAGTTFEWQGVTYQLTPRNFDIEIAFTDWLEKRAIAKLRQHKRALEPDEYQRREAAQQRDFDTGVYEYAGQLCFQALGSADGFKYMIFLQLCYANQQVKPPVTLALVEAILEDDDKGLELVTALRRINDPNQVTGEAAPTTTPTTGLPETLSV